MTSWWRSDCPARGAGLSHAHWNSCNPTAGGHPKDSVAEDEGVIHSWSTCCHCGMDQAGAEAAKLTEEEETQVIDVGQRLLDMGIGKPIAPDDIPREPKSITGQGPTGPVRGAEKHVRGYEPAYGRLPFTDEDEDRLVFFVDYSRSDAVLEHLDALDGTE